ncbi:C-type mannose receptor 2-like [Battus philenor]|uniref:C-type mannose receptor 2-like n=1 Tax=Battus philenor TaxID=42288 RepID=UPI0035CEB5DC
MRLLFVILFAFAAASRPRQNKQYRSDYEYNYKTDAFYKLHTEWVPNFQAHSTCETEGAKLMAPTSPDDIGQLHGMLKQFPDIAEMVYVGADGLDHDPAEDHPIIKLEDLDSSSNQPGRRECEVLTSEGSTKSTFCTNSLPFICKVEAKDAPYNQHCNVYGKDYEYYESIGSCYKISKNAVTWNEAYAQCAAEGAHLVVLNSVAEQQLVYNISNAAVAAQGSLQPWFIFAGIRARKTADDTQRVFKTIFNQTLNEAGFDVWAPGEPNNAHKNEYCGSIFKNEGTYNDIECSQKHGYMCEKEIKQNNHS